MKSGGDKILESFSSQAASKAWGAGVNKKMTKTKSKTKDVQTKHLRQQLEQKSLELRTQLGMPATSPVHIAMDPYDTADWAEKSHEEWIFVKKNNFEMALLREIEGALGRLRDGTYGTCMECGMPLARKRLEALPWARFCVTCQERHQSGSN